MRRVLSFLLLSIMLVSACTSGSSGSTAQNGSDALDTLSSALDWDHSPDTVLVRLDTGGGTGNPVDDLNTLPFCTVFGDGHIVWVDPFADPEQVLEDRLDDQTIRRFLEYVIGSGFYSWDAESGFVPPSQEAPGNPGPIVERITVTLYGETRTLDAFSNWPPGAFAEILDRCQHLSNSPVLFVPRGAWLSAVPVEMRSDIPSLPWDIFAESFPQVDLAAITPDNPLWATGDLAELAWEIVRSGRMQITYNGTAYRLIMQVPGIQPDAPPPPSETTTDSGS